MFKTLDSINWNDQLKSQFIIIPSGSYSGYSQSIASDDLSSLYTYGLDLTLSNVISLYNPMKAPQYQIDQRTVAQDSLQAAGRLLEHFNKGNSAYIKVNDINKYADELIKLAATIKSSQYDMLICPLRGALKPTSYLKTMNAIDTEVQWLPFTGASSGKNDKEIKGYLKQIIGKNLGDKELFTISIIDTAIEGYGINKLTDLLIQLREFFPDSQNWIIRFYIIHPSTANTVRIESVQRKSTSNLQFIVHRSKVDSLLVEDWEPALGINIRFSGSSIEAKNGIQSGRIILKDNDSILVVDSDEMSKYVDVLIASKISEAMATHPDLKYVEDVWQDYIYK
jgi:hypothetical protein